MRLNAIKMLEKDLQKIRSQLLKRGKKAGYAEAKLNIISFHKIPIVIAGGKQF